MCRAMPLGQLVCAGPNDHWSVRLCACYAEVAGDFLCILEKLPRSAEASLPLHCPNTSPACIVEFVQPCCTACTCTCTWWQHEGAVLSSALTMGPILVSKGIWVYCATVNQPSWCRRLMLMFWKAENGCKPNGMSGEKAGKSMQRNWLMVSATFLSSSMIFHSRTSTALKKWRQKHNSAAMRRSSGVCEEAAIDFKLFVLHDAACMHAAPFLQDVSACLPLHMAHFLNSNSYVGCCFWGRVDKTCMFSFCNGLVQAFVKIHRHVMCWPSYINPWNCS